MENEQNFFSSLKQKFYWKQNIWYLLKYNLKSVNKIILALDTTNLDEAINTTKIVKDKIFTIKLGLEFFNAHGKEGVKKFNELGINNLMLDLKLKDIPETVYKAKKAADDIRDKPKIMMVTILTALNDEDLKAIGSNNTVNEQVKKLAELAKETGVGIVCSGHEAKTVRKIIGPDFLIFTPGIRMARENANDQVRVCTPNDSLLNGADKIIMGRSLLNGDVEENLNKVSNSIKT